jgi:hypothetical protein
MKYVQEFLFSSAINFFAILITTGIGIALKRTAPE